MEKFRIWGQDRDLYRVWTLGEGADGEGITISSPPFPKAKGLT
jgi:hypothetical protein